MNRKLLFGSLVWGLCVPVWAADSSGEKLNAMFYYDLGPEEIDVSGYPKLQRENYLIFKRVCSQCHTPARALNAPLVRRGDWSRYVRRMHSRSKVRPWTKISKKEANAIIDFLSFDSKKRKTEDKTNFDQLTQNLKMEFEKVKLERAKKQLESDREKTVPPAPYTGTKP